MPDVKVDDSYARWLASAPDSPVIRALDDAADRVLHEAQLMAPVSLAGSKFAPPGFTKEHVTKSAVTHDDDSGDLMILVGSRTNRHGGAYPYPIAFVWNAAGVTVNRGGRSARRADDDFLIRALDAAAVS